MFSDRRSAQVMKDSARTARLPARGRPRLAERENRLRVLLAATTLGDHPEEDLRDDVAARFKFISSRTPVLLRFSVTLPSVTPTGRWRERGLHVPGAVSERPSVSRGASVGEDGSDQTLIAGS
jgi:hypothetical protein